ncbi:MotA/TolQ/ExbB proton channel family protein [Acidisphaera sp. S103]|uniref:MotA/TolQ/ExbB proton channel family protein n=1 Tax=Acidisphaera sp. S103 TaxID=1747223 RepID=UPI00131E073B|nr:MotA/TolQ/ExbB proton channel family protein [Acidisphaera sp. S103]
MEQVSDVINALRVGGVAVYPLGLLAVVAIVIVIDKMFLFFVQTRLPQDLVALVENYGFGWDALAQRLGRLGARNHFARFLSVILDNRTHPVWWVESRAADEAALIEKSLARWLWVLETIVTAAPLLGLLGTITGMIRSFKLFGNQGLVDPAGVTGGVAEALIATALGLFVALIALFAFNYCSDRQARIMDEMERLGTRVIDHIRLDTQEDRHEAALRA